MNPSFFVRRFRDGAPCPSAVIPPSSTVSSSATSRPQDYRDDALELIDNIVMKLRIVRFLRTKDYDNIFSGDSYWATLSDAGFGDDGRPMVTKTSFRLLNTPDLGAPRTWPERLSPSSGIRSCRRLQALLRQDLHRHLRHPVRVRQGNS